MKYGRSKRLVFLSILSISLIGVSDLESSDLSIWRQGFKSPSLPNISLASFRNSFWQLKSKVDEQPWHVKLGIYTVGAAGTAATIYGSYRAGSAVRDWRDPHGAMLRAMDSCDEGKFIKAVKRLQQLNVKPLIDSTVGSAQEIFLARRISSIAEHAICFHGNNRQFNISPEQRLRLIEIKLQDCFSSSQNLSEGSTSNIFAFRTSAGITSTEALHVVANDTKLSFNLRKDLFEQLANDSADLLAPSPYPGQVNALGSLCFSSCLELVNQYTNNLEDSFKKTLVLALTQKRETAEDARQMQEDTFAAIIHACSEEKDKGLGVPIFSPAHWLQVVEAVAASPETGEGMQDSIETTKFLSVLQKAYPGVSSDSNSDVATLKLEETVTRKYLTEWYSQFKESLSPNPRPDEEEDFVPSCETSSSSSASSICHRIQREDYQKDIENYLKDVKNFSSREQLVADLRLHLGEEITFTTALYLLLSKFNLSNSTYFIYLLQSGADPFAIQELSDGKWDSVLKNWIQRFETDTVVAWLINGFSDSESADLSVSDVTSNNACLKDIGQAILSNAVLALKHKEYSLYEKMLSVWIGLRQRICSVAESEMEELERCLWQDCGSATDISLFQEYVATGRYGSSASSSSQCESTCSSSSSLSDETLRLPLDILHESPELSEEHIKGLRESKSKFFEVTKTAPGKWNSAFTWLIKNRSFEYIELLLDRIFGTKEEVSIRSGMQNNYRCALKAKDVDLCEAIENFWIFYYTKGKGFSDDAYTLELFSALEELCSESEKAAFFNYVRGESAKRVGVYDEKRKKCIELFFEEIKDDLSHESYKESFKGDFRNVRSISPTDALHCFVTHVNKKLKFSEQAFKNVWCWLCEIGANPFAFNDRNQETAFSYVFRDCGFRDKGVKYLQSILLSIDFTDFFEKEFRQNIVQIIDVGLKKNMFNPNALRCWRAVRKAKGLPLKELSEDTKDILPSISEFDLKYFCYRYLMRRSGNDMFYGSFKDLNIVDQRKIISDWASAIDADESRLDQNHWIFKRYTPTHLLKMLSEDDRLTLSVRTFGILCRKMKADPFLIVNVFNSSRSYAIHEWHSAFKWLLVKHDLAINEVAEIMHRGLDWLELPKIRKGMAINLRYALENKEFALRQKIIDCWFALKELRGEPLESPEQRAVEISRLQKYCESYHLQALEKYLKAQADSLSARSSPRDMPERAPKSKAFRSALQENGDTPLDDHLASESLRVVSESLLSSGASSSHSQDATPEDIARLLYEMTLLRSVVRGSPCLSTNVRKEQEVQTNVPAYYLAYSKSYDA